MTEDIFRHVIYMRTADRLRKLGVKQVSEFSWAKNPTIVSPELWDLVFQTPWPDDAATGKAMSAFTIFELMERMPADMIRDYEGRLSLYRLSLVRVDGRWMASYQNDDGFPCVDVSKKYGQMPLYRFDKNPANALAELWALMIEMEIAKP